MRIVFLCFCLAAVSLAGCRGRPLLPAPGPLNQQQSRAVVHDPFPQPDIGVDEAAARPRDYQHPLPQPRRDRMFWEGWFNR
jgi:hypothetical protein